MAKYLRFPWVLTHTATVLWRIQRVYSGTWLRDLGAFCFA